MCKAGYISLVLSQWQPQARTVGTIRLCARVPNVYNSIGEVWCSVCDFPCTSVFVRHNRVSRHALHGSKRSPGRTSCLQSPMEPEREQGDHVLQFDVGPAFTSHASVQLTYYSDADCTYAPRLRLLAHGDSCQPPRRSTSSSISNVVQSVFSMSMWHARAGQEV